MEQFICMVSWPNEQKNRHASEGFLRLLLVHRDFSMYDTPRRAPTQLELYSISPQRHYNVSLASNRVSKTKYQGKTAKFVRTIIQQRNAWLHQSKKDEIAPKYIRDICGISMWRNLALVGPRRALWCSTKHR